MPDDSSNKQAFTESTKTVGTDKLKQLAGKAPPSDPSILDGLAQPIRLEDAQVVIFRAIFPQLAAMADNLGYGWVGGVNSDQVGEDYIYVGPGTVLTSSDKKTTITGPAFAPNLVKGPNASANGTGYMGDIRTSFEFTDVALVTVDSVKGGSLVMGPETEAQPDSITTFSVDNSAAQAPTTSRFSAQIFTQSAVGVATSKSFSSDFHWDVSMTETFQYGGEMFPMVSVSSTQSVGASSSSSQSDTTSNNLTKGTTNTYEFSHETPAGVLGEYSIMADSGTVAVAFTSKVVLQFGVKIHGFLRWGGGKPFQGPTNYHVQFSGSGDRPMFDMQFGGKYKSFWQDLADQVAQNAAPWNWNAMFQQIPGSQANVQALIAKVQQVCKFPMDGVMASIKRDNVRFKTVSETRAGAQPTPQQARPPAPAPSPAPAQSAAPPAAQDSDQDSDQDSGQGDGQDTGQDSTQDSGSNQ